MTIQNTFTMQARGLDVPPLTLAPAEELIAEFAMGRMALGVRNMIFLSCSAPNDYAGLRAYGLNVVYERTFGRSALKSGSTV